MARQKGDDRALGPMAPVGRLAFDQVSWSTGEGHAAATTIRYVNMTIDRIDVLISSVTANPTVNLTFADDNSVTIIDATNFTGLADGTKHTLWAKKATADFTEVSVNGEVTVTVDPSADPGGSDQVLTVDVIFYGR